jgi:hypothetical protein
VTGRELGQIRTSTRPVKFQVALLVGEVAAGRLCNLSIEMLSLVRLARIWENWKKIEKGGNWADYVIKS